MTCAEAVELLPVFLDGELAVLEMIRLQQHLGQCEVCRAAQASDAWLYSLLAAGALAEAPPDALRRRIRLRIAQEVASSRPIRARWIRFVLPAAVGAALSLVIALLIASHHGGPRSMASALFAEVLAGHREYGGGDPPRLDVRGDARRLERWIRDRIGVAVRLPSADVRGAPPVGARLVTLVGEPAVQILYGNQQDSVSLFVARTPSRRLPEEGEHVIDGVDVYTTAAGSSHLGWWEDDGHLYLAVSSSGREDLLKLAALCLQSQRAGRGGAHRRHPASPEHHRTAHTRDEVGRAARPS